MKILGFENKIIDYVIKHKGVIFFGIITLVSLMVRFAGRDVLSDDMSGFLYLWYDQIKNNGHIHALSSQVGDYNLLYQTFIAFISYFDAPCIYMFKAFSVLFDYALAVVGALYICSVNEKKAFSGIFNISYMALLFAPTVIINSSYWGQCDVIYTFWGILAIILILKDKIILGFISFGIALAFKFQAIFFLPVIICLYVVKRKFSILNIFISIATFWLSGIVTFVEGRDLLAGFKIYIKQTGEYQTMWYNAPSFWEFLGEDYASLHSLAMCVFLMLCALMLFLIIYHKVSFETDYDVFRVMAWFLWAAMLFLPRMHERYSFALDVVLVFVVLFDIRNLWYMLIEIMCSTVMYGYYLFLNDGVGVPVFIVYFVAWALYSRRFLLDNAGIDTALKKEMKQV